MLIKLLARWILIALGILIVPTILGGIHVGTFYIALVLAFIFGFINAVIRPILILFTLPINIITLGLFTLLINAFLFWLPSTFIAGFEIESPQLLWALAGSFMVSVFSWIAGKIIAD
jgi:putative membrane protein